jgi:hypothetical protein
VYCTGPDASWLFDVEHPRFGSVFGGLAAAPMLVAGKPRDLWFDS